MRSEADANRALAEVLTKNAERKVALQLELRAQKPDRPAQPAGDPNKPETWKLIYD